MWSLDFLWSKCKNRPAVVVNIIRKLSNYSGKAFVFSENSSYSPQFSKRVLFGGVCLRRKTKRDNSKASLTNVTGEYTFHVWLVQLKDSHISVHWSFEVITER